ncbi:MAG TPA: hypothetical protein VGN51_12570 [Acidimicrobiia bacterium]
MLTHSRRSRVARFWAALAVLVVVPATLAVSTSSAGAAGSNTLTVTAGEYTYQLKGSPKAGWTQINFDNAGVENHMMAVFKLKKGTTPAAFKKALLASDQSAFEKIAAPGGDPNVGGTPALVGPGQKTTTLTEVPAGTYGVACFLPAPDGSPHVSHGMFKIFTISGKSSLKPPTDGVADVTLTDTAITVPPGAAPKNLTVKVTNEGSATHSFQLVKLADGKTLDDANTYFNALFNTGTAPEGTPPATLVGGAQSLAPNGIAYVEWALPAGHYGYVSTDGNDPPDDDFTKGLKGEFDIS